MDVYDLKLMMKKTDMFGRPLPPKLWFFTDKDPLIKSLERINKSLKDLTNRIGNRDRK